MSVSFTPWLVGDSFIYTCVQQFVPIGSLESECMATNDEAAWSLSSEMDNLPMCGNLFIF